MGVDRMNDKIDFGELFNVIGKIYDEMPFNKLLGIKMEEFSLGKAVIGVSMKEDLVGNTYMKILHGGVIASVLDFAGGVVAQLSVIEQMKEATPEELTRRLVQMGTIDMRIDFIRPGRGNHFRATGEILRLGNKVAVSRTVLHNDEDVLIAAGTGTYLVG